MKNLKAKEKDKHELKAKKKSVQELRNFLNKGQQHNVNGEYQEALECFKLLINKNAEEIFEYQEKIRFYDSYAIALFENQEFELALDYLTKAINLGEKQLDKTNLLRNLANRGVCNSNLGQQAAAIEDCLKVEKENPDDKKIYNIHGDVLFRMMEFGQAKEQYDRSIKVKNKSGYYGRAGCLYELGDYAAAITDFLKTMEEEREKETKSRIYYSVCCDLAHAYQKLGDKQNSEMYIGILETAIEKEKLSIKTSIYFSMARILIYIKGDFDKAMVAFANFFESRKQLSGIINKNKDDLETLQLQQLIKKNKERAEQILQLQKDLKDDRDILESISHGRFSAQVHLHKAIALSYKGDHKGASLALAVALKLCKNTWFAIEDLANVIKIYLNAKMFTAAKEFCDRAIDKAFNGKLYNFYFYKALACYGLEQKEEARDNFHKAVELTPILLVNKHFAFFMQVMYGYTITEKVDNSDQTALEATLNHLNTKVLLPNPMFEWFKFRTTNLNEKTSNLQPRRLSAPAMLRFFSAKVLDEKTESKKTESEKGKEETSSDNKLSN